MEMTAEQKKFFDQMMELGKTGKTFSEVVAEVAMGIDDVKQIKDLTDAVKQLEDHRAALDADIKGKLDAARQAAYDVSGNYRGVFASEDQSRQFALICMAQAGNGDQKAFAQKVIVAEYKDLSPSVDASGGVFVGTEFSSRIQRLVETYGSFFANAFRMPMTGDSLTFIRRTAGVVFRRLSELVAPDKTDPAWATVNLNPVEVGGYTVYPITLQEDALVAIGELLGREFAQGFAQSTDEAGYTGDGGAASMGFYGITNRLLSINGVDDGGGLVLGTGAGGAGWGGLVEADFLKLVGQTRFQDGNEKFTTSHEFYWNVMAPIQLSKGGVTAREQADGPQLQFLGKEVDLTPAMPRVAGNSQVACLFGDIRKSTTIGERMGMTIRASDAPFWLQRAVAVMAIARIDINNHTLGDANTAGPVTGLITPTA
jgi:Phage capsid family